MLLLAAIMLCIAVKAFATHNRAGEIVYQHISGYKYKIIVYTYCYTLTEADRDDLEVDCGDGTGKITVKRISKTNLDDINTISYSNLCKNVYEGEHTFSGPGTYVLYMEDPNRNEGVTNIPNSVNVVFAIKTTLIINAVTGNNNSPILLNAPMDKAALNKTFVHNPGAYDPDGDSLSYRIAICLQQDAQEIVGYSFPPVTDSIYVNPTTGDFVWERPSKVGTYNVAMWIDEWRNGVKIGQMLRDIQVEVIDTDNHTPIIEKTGNHCVVAGSLLEFDITASDPDHDKLKMEANGGPFVVDESPATFTVNNPWTKTPIGHFSWETTHNHVRNNAYDMLVKVTDDDANVPLTAYNTVRIRVIAPPPVIEETTVSNSSIHLVWNNGGNEKATGYRIYRKDRLDEYEPGICETGVPASSGYELVGTTYNGKETSYVDEHLASGFRYCYRITAIFADGAESQPSEPVCKILEKGLITIIKASVINTDETNGSVEIGWTEPEEIDPELMPPPYYYHVYAAHGIHDGVFYDPTILEGIEHNSYIDKGFDTKNKGGLYKIAFVNESNSDNGTGTKDASSVFITLKPSDRRITITYDCDVPWRNEGFEVYRKDPNKTDFEYVATTSKTSYTDYNLVNGEEYGYKIKTIGYYSAPGLPTHIENWSQEAYATPIDTIAPCVNFNLKSECNEMYNLLQWTPDTTCGLGIEKYIIYYSETLDGTLTKIDETLPDVYEYKHYPTIGMAGCYYVAARDSAGNEGTPHTRICVDQCDYYRLPNVFTPNGDGKNDIYHPYPYQFVDHVDMTITNRWGKVVFTSSDPDLNWDGTDESSGEKLPDGVYFYRCIVYEHRLTGIEDRELQGFITIYTKETKSY